MEASDSGRDLTSTRGSSPEKVEPHLVNLSSQLSVEPHLVNLSSQLSAVAMLVEDVNRRFQGLEEKVASTLEPFQPFKA